MFKSLRTFGVILALLVTGLLTTALLPGEKSARVRQARGGGQDPVPLLRGA